jgi:hypothetical protein
MGWSTMPAITVGQGIVSSKRRWKEGKRGPMADRDLMAAFDDEMLRIYQRALGEADYNASRFLQMLHEHRGLETARILLHATGVSEGYTALWERGRLDLTVEAVIHDNPKWHPLFSEEDLAICKRRLTQYEYFQ